MENIASYRTVGQRAAVELKIERSRFIGHCAPADTIEDAKGFINEIQGRHHDATHNCPAYLVGTGEAPSFYSSDAGEPLGTAGRPILGEIRRNGLTNTVIVVTRYFGGKKLGIRGLIDAYQWAAAAAIKKAGIVTRELSERLTLECAYADYPRLKHILTEAEAKTTSSTFGEQVVLEVEVRRDRKNSLIDRLVPWARISLTD